MDRFASALFIVLISSSGQALVKAPTAASLHAPARGVASVVAVNGDTWDSCSGVFINDHVVLTAAHCVDPANAVMEIAEIDGRALKVPLRALSVQTDSALDLAALIFPLKTSKVFSKISGTLPANGEAGEMRGYGEDENPDTTVLPPPLPGHAVERVGRGLPLDSIDSTDLVYKLHPTRVYAAPGDSGGPIYNPKGELIGILKTYEVLDTTDQWGNLWIQNTAVYLLSGPARAFVHLLSQPESIPHE